MRKHTNNPYPGMLNRHGAISLPNLAVKRDAALKRAAPYF